jgi:hypothetical protein
MLLVIKNVVGDKNVLCRCRDVACYVSTPTRLHAYTPLRLYVSTSLHIEFMLLRTKKGLNLTRYAAFKYITYLIIHKY